MSQRMADSVIIELRKDADLFSTMAGIYPGDPTGDIQADAYIMREMADILDEYDWDYMRAEFIRSLPEVIVTQE